MNAILFNGRIYPQYRVSRRPTVLVIQGKTIAWIGDDVKAARKDFPRFETIDLQGRAVIPGLVDAHTHFFFWATTLATVHLDDTPDFAATLDLIGNYARRNPAYEWIRGDGWAADRWSEYHLPTAAELDEVTGDRPAALFSKDQHMLWVNSRALQLAGITKNTPDPNGGRIDRDPVTGRPTGILREIPGYFPVIKLISRPDPAMVEKSWRRASRIARSRGVTGFHSMDGPEAYDFFTSLHGRKRLGFRAHYYFPVKMLDEIIARGIRSGDGDGTLQVGGMKMFADGSLGAQTALMKQAYLGRPGHFGVAVTPVREMTASISKAVKHGLACAVHAIGDKAVADVISAYEGSPRTMLRNRIEHLQLIDRPDIRRLEKLGLIASMQPCHCPSDRGLVASYWGKRGRNAYIFKTLLERGVPLAFGSDCPIEPLDPLAGISAAVNRTGYGERGGRFYPEESLTVARAVFGFTAGVAYAAGREDFSGKLAPGYQADLVVLHDDIYRMPPSRIFDAKIAATIFDGRVVYRDTAAKIF